MSDAEDSRQDSDGSPPAAADRPPASTGAAPMVDITSVNKHFGDLHVSRTST